MSKAEKIVDAINLLKLIGLAGLYALLYKLPLIYFSHGGGSSSIFLASGLALAAILIGGNRYVWSIFLGVIFVHVWGSFDLFGLLGMASASSLGALTGAWLLRRDQAFDSSLRTLPDFLKLAIFGGVIGSVITASIGTAILLYSGVLKTDTFLQAGDLWQ